MRSIIALLFITLALGVAAEPILIDRAPTLVERDVPTITNILLAVGSGLTKLDSSVKAFSGDVSQINSDSAALQATINSGTTAVTGSGNLTLNNAITLSTPVQALQPVGKTLVTDLIAQKSAFEAKGLCADLYTQMSGIQTASQGLINAIVALVPANAQVLAASLAAPFKASLAEGVAAFVSTNCTNAGTSSTSSTASPSSTTASSTSITPSTSITASSSSVTASSSSVTASSSSVTASSSSIAPSSSSVTASSSSITASSTTNPTSSNIVPGPSTDTTAVTYTSTITSCASSSQAVIKSTPPATTGPASPATTGPASNPKTTTSPGAGAGTKTTSAAIVLFTGAADVNHAANSFGIVALAAAALLL